MTGLEDRRHMTDMIQEAHDNGASLYKACESAGITVRTLQRWQTADGSIKADARPEAVRPTPRSTVVRAAMSPALPPRSVVSS